MKDRTETGPAQAPQVNRITSGARRAPSPERKWEAAGISKFNPRRAGPAPSLRRSLRSQVGLFFQNPVHRRPRPSPRADEEPGSEAGARSGAPAWAPAGARPRSPSRPPSPPQEPPAAGPSHPTAPRALRVHWLRGGAAGLAGRPAPGPRGTRARGSRSRRPAAGAEARPGRPTRRGVGESDSQGCVRGSPARPRVAGASGLPSPTPALGVRGAPHPTAEPRELPFPWLRAAGGPGAAGGAPSPSPSRRRERRDSLARCPVPRPPRTPHAPRTHPAPGRTRAAHRRAGPTRAHPPAPRAGSATSQASCKHSHNTHNTHHPP